MRACACDTASRLCVRPVLCSSAFLSIPLLPSADSAADRPVLFVGFLGTTSESDFSTPYIIGFGGCLPDAAREGTSFRGGGRDLPVPAQRACERARVSDGAGPARRSRYRAPSCCLLPL